MEEETIRVRIPREGETIGKVINLLGSNRLYVDCLDGKERVCRIPGKLKKRVWTKADDIVLIKPWDTQSDIRGDLVWRYTKIEADFLRKKGYLR